MGGHVWNAITAVLLAVGGGLARQFYEESKNSRKRKTMRQLVKDLYVAFFCGIIAYCIVMAIEITGCWIDVLCGATGWTSPTLMHGVASATDTFMAKAADVVNAVLGHKDKD